MSDNTGGGMARLERITMRILMAAAVTAIGYLQTGQWSLEGGEQARDTDTVALLKVVHRLELRLQRLEDVGHPELGPVADHPLPDPLVPVRGPLDEPSDIRRTLETIRSMVSKEEVETYQQAK